ncbi:MAG: hypothetical protein AB7N76_16770 [Planctomycetota bacterium]
MASETQTCVPPEHLFALLWAKREELPRAGDELPEGQTLDAELARLRADLDESERYKKPLPAEFQLGPETLASYWEHVQGCAACRCTLIEDGPTARPPKTEAEAAAEEQREVEKEESLKWKFGVDLTVGLIAFGGAFFTINYIRHKEYATIDQAQSTIGALQEKQIDPLYLLFAVLILVASWFLAEAYGIARELWVDFTPWKRAVPLIGKKWAEKSGKKP